MHGYERLEFVRSSLQAFGVREVEYVREGEVVLPERLLVPTPTAPSGHHNEEVIRGVRDALIGPYCGAGATTARGSTSAAAGRRSAGS